MAQTTSSLWKELWKTPNTVKEYGFDISGTWYGPEKEVQHSADSELYADLSIGNATIGQITISLFADNIPRGAAIKRYIRLKNGSRVTEWIPKGIFFINRRTEDDGYWTLEAFDSMRKAEVVWEPDQSLEFPLSMRAAVEEFARIMQVSIDPRTNVKDHYTIDYPANDYTVRQELCYIAAAHGGNWIITDKGQLLLIPLLSAPMETSYLVTEYGDPILFGDTRILV